MTNLFKEYSIIEFNKELYLVLNPSKDLCIEGLDLYWKALDEEEFSKFLKNYDYNKLYKYVYIALEEEFFLDFEDETYHAPFLYIEGMDLLKIENSLNYWNTIISIINEEINKLTIFKSINKNSNIEKYYIEQINNFKEFKSFIKNNFLK